MSKVNLPAEWASVSRIYTAWPWRKREWKSALNGAQQEVADFVRTVAEGGTPITLLVPDAKADKAARALISDTAAEIVRTRYGDIWLRDTGPFFHAGGASAFALNGWGGKHLMKGDELVAKMLAQREDAALTTHDLVLEGGAIDHDGTGLALTTEQCLLDPNRNGELTREQIESHILDKLGFDRMVWLGRGLAGDHTDGHVDNLARFFAPGKAVVPQAIDTDDPNTMVYEDAASRLARAAIEVVRIPSAGLIKDADGAPLPASYVNFALTNERVIIPTYGAPYDKMAVKAIGALFPDREAIGLSASAILTGGGAFHCMTREVPAG